MPRGVNQYDEARLQGRLWTPYLLNPALWLDGSDLSTITIATGVSEWRDKSGNGRNATQATASAQPAYTNLNGLPSILFDGTDDALSINASFFPSAVASMNFIIAAVAKENNGSYGGIISTNPGTNNTGAGILIDNVRKYQLFPPPGTLATTGTGAETGVVSGMCTSQTTSYTSALFFNGTSQGATASQTTALIHASTTIIGRYRVGDTNFGGMNLQELVVVVDNADARQRQLIEGYLAWKWGLQSSLLSTHPYANRPPVIGD